MDWASGNQFSIFANKTSDKLIIGNFVKRSLSSGLKVIDWDTTVTLYRQLTQEGDIDQGVPGGRRLEVHPAPVEARVPRPHRVYDQLGGVWADHEAGA